MKLKTKIAIYAILSLSGLLMGYLYWLSQRPVEIVAVHEDGNHSYVLVKNFPFTFKGKLNWWLENKTMLKKQYDIPKPSSYGSSTVIFWIFGEGYKEEGKYDRFCFEDMKTKFNCIEKEAVFSVSESKNMGVMFTVQDGTYRLRENGEIAKYIYN
ncbi:DUF943 family protein [Erwinia sp. MYb375]|uniref:DUF943 family protein n=1 Tax=unclassified Erwinia TaxID=2622719 RepID=UPI00309C9E0B